MDPEESEESSESSSSEDEPMPENKSAESTDIESQSTPGRNITSAVESPSSPGSPRLHFAETPEPRTSFRSFDTPPVGPALRISDSPSSSPGGVLDPPVGHALRISDTPSSSPGGVLDPPTPSMFTSVSPDTPSLLKRSRQQDNSKIPSRSTIRRRLVLLDTPKTCGADVPLDPANISSFVEPSIEHVTVENQSHITQEVVTPTCQLSDDSSDNNSHTCSDGDEDMVSSCGDSWSDSSTSGSDSDCLDGNVDVDFSPCESSDRDDAMSNDDEELLYSGSKQTVAEAVLKLMKLYTKHHWTKNCLEDSLGTFRSFLPEDNNMPTTSYLMLKFVERFSFMSSADKYYYCSNSQCFQQKDSPDEKCSSCDCEGANKFFYFSVAEQLKFLFEHRDLAKCIDSYKLCQNRDPSVISDIVDGEEYSKVMAKLQGQHDIFLLWNTDGVSVSGSSGVSLWPVLCQICNISPGLRSSFLIVVGVWCDVKKPPMDMFLKPFSTSLKSIAESGGLEWTDSTGEKHKSVVVAPALSADAPAKAEALRVMYFSALYGCNVCEQKRAKVFPAKEGSKAQGNMGKQAKADSKVVRRFVYQDEEARLRSGDRMDVQGVLAEQKKKPVKGVLGKAEVSKIPMLDRGRCVTAEYMHTVLLGVVKYLLLLWLYTAGPWNIRKHIKSIDHFLSSICVPDFVTRPPRSLKEAKPFWKASELRSWLLYYSLPALKGFLPEKYLQHWLLLVRSIFILLQDRITDSEVDSASLMLKIFVRDIKNLYGDKYYTYNIHQLLHLGLLVKRWGPLWATSAFPFETYNAVFGGLIHGTKHKGQELVNQLKLCQGVVCLQNFVERSMEKVISKSKDCLCLGKNVNVDLSSKQRTVLLEAGLVNYLLFRRAQIDGEIFSSALYDLNKQRHNSYVKYALLDKQEGFGMIEFFIKTCDNVYALLKVYNVDHVGVFFHTESLTKVNHIVPFKDSDNFLVLPLTQIYFKVIRVGPYLILRPNVVERNL